MNTRRTTLLIAIVLAVATGLMTLNYVRTLQGTAGANGQPRTVLVAVREIPARAPITEQMVRAETRPAGTVDPDALDDPARVQGALAMITIPAGSVVTASKIGRPADLALPVRIAPGTRAVSIQVDRVKDVAGLLQPGDRVDVIAVPPRTGNTPPQAAAILRGVRVLAVGSELEYPSATPSPNQRNSTTVTLEVTPKQANLLTMADLNATLRLALRSPREPIASYPAETLRFAPAETVGAPTAPAPAAPAAPIAEGPARRSAPASPNAILIDGDRITTSTASSR